MRPMTADPHTQRRNEIARRATVTEDQGRSAAKIRPELACLTCASIEEQGDSGKTVEVVVSYEA